MYVLDEQSQEMPVSVFSFWGHLFLSILFAIAAGYIGVLYNAPLSPYITVMWIIELAMLILVGVLRRRHTVSYGMAYGFTGISGLVVGVAIASNPLYMHVVGISAIETVGLFGVLSLIAISTGQLFLRFGNALFAMLIALVIVDLISFFAFRTPADLLVISSASGLLFCGFILYDIQRVFRRQHEENIPMLVISVYLDILNLFLSILNINAFFSRK